MKDYIFLLDDNGKLQKKRCTLPTLEAVVLGFLLLAIPFTITLAFFYTLSNDI